jgi:predicted ATPase
MANELQIHSIRIENYKSIAACDVPLAPITYLVGANGSGKSNFLDAICFIKDIFRHGLPRAVQARGGFRQILHQNGEGGWQMSFTLRFTSQVEVYPSYYTLKIMGSSSDDYKIVEEVVGFQQTVHSRERYTSSLQDATAFLDTHSFADELFAISDLSDECHLLSLGSFHSFTPEAMRKPQAPELGEYLRRNGSNLSSVIKRMGQLNPMRKSQIEVCLAQAVPGIVGVEVIEMAGLETLEFVQDNGRRVAASSMSDGTLRLLGTLTALLQSGHLIGLEEPEASLAPSTLAVLSNALKVISQEKQILLTTHSSDLLDDPTLSPDALLVVTSVAGASHIAPLNAACRSALVNQECTAGEMLRVGQLKSD